MLPHAFLSPVDPKGNWQVEGKQQSISVEDVVGYVDFVSDRVGIRDQSALVEALKELTKEVSATVLGSIHRTRALIERLSTNLLQLHFKDIDDKKRVDQIVDFLTHSLFTHSHLIPFAEAQDVIGFGHMVTAPDARQAAAMRETHRYILCELKSNEAFEPEIILEKQQEGQDFADVTATRALLMSPGLRHVYLSKYRVKRTQDQQVQIKAVGVPAWVRA